MLRYAVISSDFLDVFGTQSAILERFEIVLHPAQVEEQLLLRGRGAHFYKAPAPQDEFLNRGTNPPHCVSREAEAAIGLELLHTLHQADIAFGDQFADRQAVTAIAHGDLGHETQVRRNELRRSEEHTSELQSLMRISYAVFCL